MPPDQHTCAWYVESQNDLHVFMQLIKHYQLPIDVKPEPKQGVDDVLATLSAELIKQDDDRFQRLGIVVDADEDLEKRWRQVRSILERRGYTSVPSHPDANGTILIQPDKPAVGIWIMPDNTLPGELEHFIEFLIPRNKEHDLWQHAKEVVDHLPEQRFAEQNKIKAYLHSWLAWQERPGTPMGLAIAMKFLDPDVPKAERFIQWIRRLFLEEL